MSINILVFFTPILSYIYFDLFLLCFSLAFVVFLLNCLSYDNSKEESVLRSSLDNNFCDS